MRFLLRVLVLVVMGVSLLSSCYIKQDLPHPLQHKPCPNPYNPTCPTVLDSGADRPPQPRDGAHKVINCGNGRCDGSAGENCFTCPTDCGCSTGQLCARGTCTFCGNGICEPGEGETCASCIPDCGCPQGSLCASGQCQKAQQCGDGKCTGTENCTTCAADCPCLREFVCKGGSCQAAPRCGDGTCEAAVGENCQTCPKDCGCQKGQGCRGGNCYQCTCPPGQKRCFNEQVQVCSASCLEWQTIEVCHAVDALRCNPFTFACQCNPDRVCSSVGVARCGQNGSREMCTKGRRCQVWKSTPCRQLTPEHRMYCERGRCCECSPRERACHNADEYEICGGDCLWGPPRLCPPRTYCEPGGTCY